MVVSGRRGRTSGDGAQDVSVHYKQTTGDKRSRRDSGLAGTGGSQTTDSRGRGLSTGHGPLVSLDFLVHGEGVCRRQ